MATMQCTEWIQVLWQLFIHYQVFILWQQSQGSVFSRCPCRNSLGIWPTLHHKFYDSGIIVSNQQLFKGNAWIVSKSSFFSQFTCSIPSPVSVESSALLSDVLKLVCEKRIHRVWVVDSVRFLSRFRGPQNLQMSERVPPRCCEFDRYPQMRREWMTLLLI